MHAPLRKGKLQETKKCLTFTKLEQTKLNLPSSLESLLLKYFNNAVVGPETNELKENKLESAQNKPTITKKWLHVYICKFPLSHLRRVLIGLPLSKSFLRVVIVPKHD